MCLDQKKITNPMTMSKQQAWDYDPHKGRSAARELSDLPLCSGFPIQICMAQFLPSMSTIRRLDDCFIELYVIASLTSRFVINTTVDIGYQWTSIDSINYLVISALHVFQVMQSMSSSMQLALTLFIFTKFI